MPDIMTDKIRDRIPVLQKKTNYINRTEEQ